MWCGWYLLRHPRLRRLRRYSWRHLAGPTALVLLAEEEPNVGAMPVGEKRDLPEDTTGTGLQNGPPSRPTEAVPCNGRLLRGLAAVGWRACQGEVSSGGELEGLVREVCQGVRNKAMVGQGRKSTCRMYRPVLADVAALEDTVACWVHELKKLETEAKETIVEVRSSEPLTEKEHLEPTILPSVDTEKFSYEGSMDIERRECFMALKNSMRQSLRDAWLQGSTSKSLDEIEVIISEVAAIGMNVVRGLRKS